MVSLMGLVGGWTDGWMGVLVVYYGRVLWVSEIGGWTDGCLSYVLCVMGEWWMDG